MYLCKDWQIKDQGNVILKHLRKTKSYTDIWGINKILIIKLIPTALSFFTHYTLFMCRNHILFVY